jgi:hypothetical protein
MNLEDDMPQRDSGGGGYWITGRLTLLLVGLEATPAHNAHTIDSPLGI